MRIFVTADLHYDIARSREPARDIARKACAEAAPGDVIVLVGDSAGADLAVMRECLRLFADFPGPRMLIPGNHCLWCANGESSLERYENLLPGVAQEEGFSVLDHEPVLLGATALVGSVGWYDYSFADESLRIPLAFYRAKVSPGAAAYMGEHRDLLEAHRAELDDSHRSLAARWMDGTRVRLGMSDEEFVDRLAGRLERQLADASRRVERVVCFLHHLPFRPLVPANRPARFAFAAAYMGSQRFGDVLLACPKVSHVYCGHSHWPGRCNVGRIRAINVGSTYTQKRLETLDIDNMTEGSVA